MRSRERGVTLVEGIVVVAALGMGTALAFAKLQTYQVRKNEKAVIATLHRIDDAQRQFQDAVAIDLDQNGIGEYGFFAELAGSVVVRAGTQPVAPPLLSSAFGNVTAQSNVARSGYLFRMYLPDASSRGLTETPMLGGDPGNTLGVDPRRANRLWCCYAWPISYGTTGKRTFFVNQDGEILSTGADIPQYTGSVLVPLYSAAFHAASSGALDCPVAADTMGIDGNLWDLVH